MTARLLVALCLLFSFGARAAGAAEPLLLNTGTRYPYTSEDGQGFLDLAIAEAFRRVGRDARVAVYAASKRALAHANAGIDDGAAMRVRGLEASLPNLIRVPEKLIDNDFVAYSLRRDMRIVDWGSLRPYDVGYILGWKVFERGLGANGAATRVRGPEQLFTLLAKRRVDAVLYERWQGLWRARRLGLDVVVHEPPLARREMFIYLHKKHADLVKPVARALRAMKRDGTYQAIVDRVLTPLLTPAEGRQ
jgi:polar amino acid transport system substrate-binding protein